MALTTRCPNCRTAFKVVADQLRVRNGLVRCGSCGTVFDGRACLEGGDVAPPPVPQPIPAPAPFAAPVVSAAPVAPVMPAVPSAPIEPPPFPSFLAHSQAGSLVGRAAEFPATGSPAAGSPAAGSPAAGSPAAGSGASINHPPFLSAEPPAVLRGRDRRMPEQAPAPAAEPDEAREDDDALDSDAIYTDEKHDVMPSVVRAAEPVHVIRARDAHEDYGVHEAHEAHAPIRAYDPEDYPPEEDEPEFTVGAVRQEVADEESAGESVYGELRTRYSSATDVGRAPPQFLDQDLIKSHHARRRLWTWLCMLGLIALAGQLLYVYRTPISVSMPKLRPAFVGVCRVLGCKVSYARRIERIWIESSSLRMTPQNNAQQAAQAPAGAQPAADDTQHMILGAVLRNRYEKDQEWPALDLKLRDKSDTVVAEKIIYPKDYLPPGTTGPMAAGAEVPISVPIVVKGLQINGFGLQVFFPLNSPLR